MFKVGSKGTGRVSGMRVEVIEVFDDGMAELLYEDNSTMRVDSRAHGNFKWDDQWSDYWNESFDVAKPVSASATVGLNSYPTTKTEAEIRKGQPVFTGVAAYFPDALKAVAEVSRIGNDQHNPGQPLHWARGKSADQLDAAMRHMLDHLANPIDTDGGRHLAKAAWRLLAELQLDIEKGGL